MKMISNKKKLLEYLIKYNLILLPFFLITGPFLSDLAITTSSIAFLFLIKKKYLLEITKNKYILIFISFWIYICFNAVLNNPSVDTYKISLSYVRFGLFLLSTFYILSVDKNFDLLKKIYVVFTACFVFLSIDGFFQYFNGSNLLGYKLAEGPRVSSFFGDELILGSYVSRLFPLYFGLTILLYRNNIKKIIFSSIVFIFLEVLVFLSGERSSFFYMNLSMLFILICINEFRILRLFTYIASILIIILIHNLKPNSFERIYDRTISQMNLKIELKNGKNKSEDKKIYIFSKYHNDYYVSSINMFKSNPFFGIGIKNFRNFCDNPAYATENKFCSTHPHNNYIQLLAETGIFGFIFLLFLLFNFIYLTFLHLIKKIKKQYIFNSFEICILSGVLITLWPFVPTGSIFNNWLNIIYYMPLGFLYWSFKNRSKKKLTI